MKRVLVNIAVLCCSLVAVGCLILWPISYWYSYRGYIGQHRGTSGVGFDIRSTPGAAEFVLITFQADEKTPPGGFRHYVEALRWADEPNVVRHWEWVHYGFGFHAWDQPATSTRKYTNHYLGAGLPLWFLALLFSLPAILMLRHRRRRRRRADIGLCPTCGYDLRATPDRCPECGTINSALQQKQGTH